jgi:hypothetical protein
MSIRRFFIAVSIAALLFGYQAARAADSTKPTTRASATTQSSEIPAPTRITLKVDHGSGIDAMQQLFRLANLPTETVITAHFGWRVEDMPVTVDLVDQPFCIALLELCRQTRLEPAQSPAPDRPTRWMMRSPFAQQPGRPARPTTRKRSVQSAINPTSQPTSGPTSRPNSRPRKMVAGNGVMLNGPGPSWVDAPAFVAGPLVLVPADIRRASWVDLDAGGAPTRDMNLNVRVLRDPALRLFAIADRLDIDEARDDQGRSLIRPGKPPEPTRPHSLSDSERSIWNVVAPLAYPSEGAKSIALLRGHLNATIVTRSEPIELLDEKGVLIPGQRKAGDVQFTIHKLEESGDGSQLSFTIQGGDGEAGSSPEAWDAIRALVHGDAFKVTDAAGRLYWINSQVHSYQQNQFYTGFIHFRPYQAFGDDAKAAKMPTKITWNVPAEIQDVSIPVELKNLPLP